MGRTLPRYPLHPLTTPGQAHLAPHLTLHKTMATQTTQTYDFATIQEDARILVQQGKVHRHQPIYTLLAHLPHREHTSFEQELTRHEYLLRDRIADLIPQERWQND